MRFLWKHKRVAVLSTAVVAAVLVGIVFWRAAATLRTSKDSVSAERDLRFTVRPFSPLIDSGFEWVSAPANFTQAAEFQGHLYVATPTGLLEFDEHGVPGREFRVGRELPPSPLVKLVRATLADSREPELVIGTAGDGVLVFNGTSFRQILPESRDARSVTALLALSSGHLLIGTEKRGLLVYDGHRVRPFHPTLARLHVTELAGSESDLWIGTQDAGVGHFHGGATEWFNETNGLPDTRVYTVTLSGDRTYVGTSAGIAEFERGRFSRVLAAGAFVRSLLPTGNGLLAGTMDDGVLEISLAHTSRNARQQESLGDLDEVEQLFTSGDRLYAVSAHRIFVRESAGWKRVLEPRNGLLADRNISALAMDTSGRLWVGYFDRGLDVVDGDGNRSRHIEDDRVFCVNRILPNAAHGSTAVATANGLVLFDSHGNKHQVLGRADGLIADHVTDIASYRDGMVVATPAGLTFLDSGGVRSLYAFHGLVNNHVYALAANGNRLMAGTLGGATLLEDDQVRVSYTTATSALKHNWITAIVPLGDEWWIGTYGAGMVRLSAAGKFEASDGASGDLIINPNAMIASERFLAAGSMGHGLYVMERATGKWSAVTAGLPSLNVSALAIGKGYLYVGTDNGLVRIPEQRLAR